MLKGVSLLWLTLSSLPVDIYEQWNTYPFNRQTIHMNTSFTGACNLSISHNAVAPIMTNYNYTQDCKSQLYYH